MEDSIFLIIREQMTWLYRKIEIFHKGFDDQIFLVCELNRKGNRTMSFLRDNTAIKDSLAFMFDCYNLRVRGDYAEKISFEKAGFHVEATIMPCFAVNSMEPVKALALVPSESQEKSFEFNETVYEPVKMNVDGEVVMLLKSTHLVLKVKHKSTGLTFVHDVKDFNYDVSVKDRVYVDVSMTYRSKAKLFREFSLFFSKILKSHHPRAEVLYGRVNWLHSTEDETPENIEVLKSMVEAGWVEKFGVFYYLSGFGNRMIIVSQIGHKYDSDNVDEK